MQLRCPKRSVVFQDLDEAYSKSVSFLSAVASKHLCNKDYAIDLVHDVFAKAIQFFNDNPDKKVRLNVLFWLVIKECRKYNKKYGRISQVSYDTVKEEVDEGA